MNFEDLLNEMKILVIMVWHDYIKDSMELITNSLHSILEIYVELMEYINYK